MASEKSSTLLEMGMASEKSSTLLEMGMASEKSSTLLEMGMASQSSHPPCLRWEWHHRAVVRPHWRRES